MECPCDSKKTYKTCCEPFIEENAYPETAEQLMRSRYTAYTKALMPYLKKTMALETQKEFDAESARKWAVESKWLGLEIHSTDAGQATDSKGVVVFTARFEQNGTKYEHRERSLFARDRKNHWCFLKAEEAVPAETIPIVRQSAKVGRNDLCPCGSQKKFKKCCESKSA